MTDTPRGEQGETEGGESLRPDLRPRAFAATELLLDLIHAARLVVDLDLDSMVIYACVNEATVRPMILDPSTPPEVLTMAEPPEKYRGSISRLLVADRTGLARETVRRKIKQLIEAGLLMEDAEGRIRTLRNLAQPNVRQAVDDMYAAVQRYQKRLVQLGCAGPLDNPSPPGKS